MGLWDDLYRTEMAYDVNESFEDVGGAYTPPPLGDVGDTNTTLTGSKSKAEGSSSEDKKEKTDPLARSRSEGLAGGSDGADTLGRSRDQGLQGGSSGTLGDGDAEVSARNAAREAQQKTQSSPDIYNGSVSAIINTPQSAPKQDGQIDPDTSQALANMDIYERNWTTV